MPAMSLFVFLPFLMSACFLMKVARYAYPVRYGTSIQFVDNNQETAMNVASSAQWPKPKPGV